MLLNHEIVFASIIKAPDELPLEEFVDSIPSEFGIDALLAFLLFLVIAAICFFIGAIPFGYLIGKSQGVDIREHGSGNIGATNAFRILGKKWGVIVFILDFLKAAVPLAIIYYLLDTEIIPMPPPSNHHLYTMLCGIAVVLGHNYSPFLDFKGGKGIASTAGFIAVTMPLVAGFCLFLWILTFMVTRYVAVASLIAAAGLPVLAYLFYTGTTEWPYYVFSAFFTIFAVVRHWSNIERLAQGTEHRFGPKDDEDEDTGPQNPQA